VWNVRYLVTKVGEVGGGTICSQSVLVITTYNKTFSPNQIHKVATGEGGGYSLREKRCGKIDG